MIRAKISFDFGGEKYIRNLAANVEKTVARGAIMVENEAKRLLNTSGKSFPAKLKINKPQTASQRKANVGISRKTRKEKGLYWYGEPLHRWVQSSAKGTPPHKQTGRLQRSITHERNNKKIEYKVGPSNQLKYARRLEIGDLDRPYLLPAFSNLEAKILRMLQDTVKDTKP